MRPLPIVLFVLALLTQAGLSAAQPAPSGPALGLERVAPPAPEPAVPPARTVDAPAAPGAPTSPSPLPPGYWFAPPKAPLSQKGLFAATLTLGIISATHLSLALGLVIGRGKNTDALLITEATFAGVGVLAGAAALTVGLVGSRMTRTVLIPLPLQLGPLVARSGGGLSLQGAF